jgi:ParB family chromosome partitioning protein
MQMSRRKSSRNTAKINTTEARETPVEIVSLSKLVLSEHNVRKIGEQNVDQLAASILEHGLLQSLVCISQGADGPFEVIAGGRRFKALRKSADEGRISANFPVPITIKDGAAAEEVSLAENVLRESMHPVDQFLAFSGLIDRGEGVEAVAARFGVTTRYVHQMMRLARLSPVLIEACKAGELNLDELMALL